MARDVVRADLSRIGGRFFESSEHLHGTPPGISGHSSCSCNRRMKTWMKRCHLPLLSLLIGSACESDESWEGAYTATIARTTDCTSPAPGDPASSATVVVGSANSDGRFDLTVIVPQGGSCVLVARMSDFNLANVTPEPACGSPLGSPNATIGIGHLWRAQGQLRMELNWHPTDGIPKGCRQTDSWLMR